MDTTPLVADQIDDGQKLIDQLVRDGFDVTVAFWVGFTSDPVGPWFYIASKTVDEVGLHTAYRAVHAAIQRIPPPWGPWISVSDVGELRLVGVNDPFVRDVLAFRDRSPGRNRFRGVNIGGRIIDELFIYPPAMNSAGADDRWRGVAIWVYPESPPSEGFFVEFCPRELQAALGPDGQARRVPRPAGVRVRGGQVLEYRPPEKPLPHLTQNDYEQKALESVAAQLSPSGT
jgi:hypothetical protein